MTLQKITTEEMKSLLSDLYNRKNKLENDIRELEELMDMRWARREKLDGYYSYVPSPAARLGDIGGQASFETDRLYSIIRSAEQSFIAEMTTVNYHYCILKLEMAKLNAINMCMMLLSPAIREIIDVFYIKQTLAKEILNSSEYQKRRGFSQPSITRHKKEALKAITDAYNDYILGAVFTNEIRSIGEILDSKFSIKDMDF